MDLSEKKMNLSEKKILDLFASIPFKQNHRNALPAAGSLPGLAAFCLTLRSELWGRMLPPPAVDSHWGWEGFCGEQAARVWKRRGTKRSTRNKERWANLVVQWLGGSLQSQHPM